MITIAKGLQTNMFRVEGMEEKILHVAFICVGKRMAQSGLNERDRVRDLKRVVGNIALPWWRV